MGEGSKTAYIFPGQGSQVVGMGRELYENFAASRAVFDEADSVLGFALSEMCFGGTAEDLALTANTQPAILTTSVAALRAMESEGFDAPDFVAGHSLGEYSALVAAGALSFADAVRTVRKRGSYMQEAVPVGVGAMAAILGLSADEVAAGCEAVAGDEVCSPANLNSPSQIVIAGHAAAIDRAIEELKGRGAKRAIKLNVSAPFHCALMKPAQDRLESDLKAIGFNDLVMPLIENVSAKPNQSGDRARTAVTEQVSNPVKWAPSVETMLALGVGTFVEVGAGKVLCGLVRQVSREARCLNVEDGESLRNSLSSLTG